MAQWLRRWAFIQRTRVKSHCHWCDSLGGVNKGIRSKLRRCSGKVTPHSSERPPAFATTSFFYRILRWSVAVSTTGLPTGRREANIQQAVGGRPPRYASAPASWQYLRIYSPGGGAVPASQHLHIFIRQVAPVPTCWLYKTSTTSWPLTFWPWKWCPSDVWHGLPFCQF